MPTYLDGCVLNPFEICDITLHPDRAVIGPAKLFPSFVEVDNSTDAGAIRVFLMSAEMVLGGAEQLRLATEQWPEIGVCFGPTATHADVVDAVMRAVETGALVAALVRLDDVAGTTEADLRAAGIDKRLPPPRPGNNVAGMSFGDKMMRACEMVPDEVGDKLGAQARKEIEGFFSVQNLAITAGILVVWAGSHAVGVGFIVDGVLLGVGLAFAGWEALKAFEKVGEFFTTVDSATSDRDLKVAAGLLAAAITILSVAGFKALLRRVTPKIPKGGSGKKGKGGNGGGSTDRTKSSGGNSNRKRSSDADGPEAQAKPKNKTEDAPAPKPKPTHDFTPVASKISTQKQYRHVKDRPEWVQRGQGSYFNSTDDAQAVLTAAKNGKAEVLGTNMHGFPIVRVKGVTGYNNNPRAGYLDQPTDIFIIKGTAKPSVVPTNPNWSD
ncbi:hypothetical protein [Actibacterium sp. 188UL27-1]|uniref:hypothetical protein n=1 Tax=Actibacterium sp. 188UL27-1 TaxID=2786961 RepID=UPI00195B981A|nr:hypothetical protein [Actibacterium sp. 188UL27-1]MBM7067865.1 hypothetical protein [Actibacterium sp. 188UL27-1]